MSAIGRQILICPPAKLGLHRAMAKAHNPLKWQGIDALSGRGLNMLKLPGKLGGLPLFYATQLEITPFFIFTPHLKFGAVNVSGLLGLSFAGVDDFVNSSGKNLNLPAFRIYTANFPGDLAPYIFPEAADEGAFEDWATKIDVCVRSYPTSAEELKAQVRDGRLGGFGAAQQFKACPPDEALNSWFADQGIEVPTDGTLPIQAVTTPASTIQ
jgi:hypothetical protein